MKIKFLKWLRILQNKNYTGLSSESWAFRKLICEVSIFTPKVLFPIYIAGSKIQLFRISGFLSTAMNSKKIGTDLYLVCSCTLKFKAVASTFFLRYRSGIFLKCPVTSGGRKNSKIFRECNTFFLFIMWIINLASFSAVLQILIFLQRFVFSAVRHKVRHSRKSRASKPLFLMFVVTLIRL